MDKSRKISFAILRILAAFSEVTLHVSSRYIMGNPVDSSDFYFANFQQFLVKHVATNLSCSALSALNELYHQ